MWISSFKLDALREELVSTQRLLRDSMAQAAYWEAKLDANQDLIARLLSEVEDLTKEKKELLDELLIASGVKMSKYQEQILKKQLEQSGDDVIDTGNQTRNWAQKMERESFLTNEQKNQRAIQIVAELEREAALNTGGLGNV
jgi:hypothetical protein